MSGRIVATFAAFLYGLLGVILWESGGVPAPLMLSLGGAATFSAIILVVAASRKPRIGALIERAALGVLIAFFALVYGVVAWDTDLGRVLFSSEGARFLVRYAGVLLFTVPTAWTFLYLTGRLGDDGRGGPGTADEVYRAGYRAGFAAGRETDG